jgi:prepilin-type N-terminal cleavage/methylation domain-containing protein
MNEASVAARFGRRIARFLRRSSGIDPLGRVRSLDRDDGFTLIEIIVATIITGIIIVAIGSALVVTLRTNDSTDQRISENHDVQIESAYLANDVQSAASVNVPGSGANCSGGFTTLVTLTYGGTGSPAAVYSCGTASNGETQVTRTFGGGLPIVLAHFAGAARPNVVVTNDPAAPSVPVSVAITFTKSSSCTLDCTYTLFGSRRGYNPPGSVVTGGGTPNATVLSTGTSSPLWVQGSCPDPGTSPSGAAACVIDPGITALPTTDVRTTGWTPTPLSTRLNDMDTSTFVTSTAGNTSEAIVNLSAVNPPASGFNPFVEFHAAPVQNGFSGSIKVTLTIYDSTGKALVSNDVGPINGTTAASYDWSLNNPDTNKIPAAAYGSLRIGFSVSSAKASNNQAVIVDGVAFDTASPAGLLTIKGPLQVNSQLSNAVRLTGSKTATKISIINGGDFEILNPGACSGCNHNTVTCAACAWPSATQPWTSYPNSIPDPLRALPAPDPSTLGTGSCDGAGNCTPGVYNSGFSITSGGSLAPGIYYIKGNMSVTGSAALQCSGACAGGVFFYIADGSVTLAGNGAINLPSPSSGVYQGIVMFQARNDSNALKITGNAGSGTTNVLGGIVYVPAASQVTLATGSAALTARAIVSQNIKVSSSVTIG